MQTLGRQALASQMELVLVAEHPEPGLPAALLAPFGWVQVVPHPNWTTMTDARVAGIWHARAPLVAICEDHCFPIPGWAEALVAAHHGPWAAVGPAILNANPVTRVSWANLAIEYGPWLHPVASGACAHVPGHNSSYKRAAAAWNTATSSRRCSRRKASCTGTCSGAARRSPWSPPRAPGTRTSRDSGRRFCSGSAAAGSSPPTARIAGRWWRRALYSSASIVLPVVRTWRTLRHLRRVGDTRPRRGLGAGRLHLALRGRRRAKVWGMSSAQGRPIATPQCHRARPRPLHVVLATAVPSHG